MVKVEKTIENCQSQLNILHSRISEVEQYSSESTGKVLQFISDIEICNRGVGVVEKKITMHIDFSEAQLSDLKNQIIMLKSNVAEEIEQNQSNNLNFADSVNQMIKSANPDATLTRIQRLEEQNNQVVEFINEIEDRIQTPMHSEKYRSLDSRVKILEKCLEKFMKESKIASVRVESFLKSKISNIRKRFKSLEAKCNSSKPITQ
jgi:hypothetical protein